VKLLLRVRRILIVLRAARPAAAAAALVPEHRAHAAVQNLREPPEHALPDGV
jgi:hypothetical protein